MNPELQLLLWVTGSFVVGLIVTALAHRSGDGRRNRTLIASELGSVIAEVAIFLYYIGLPFLALTVGVVGVDLLGLGAIAVEEAATLAGFTPRDWLRGSVTAGLATGFALAALWIARRTADLPLTTLAEQPKPLLILKHAAYAEAHWAFYRAPFVLLLQDAYWGTAAGFCLIAVEWVLTQWLCGRSLTASRPQALLITCCALASGLLYLMTRNLWLMMVVHATIQWAGGRLLGRAAQTAAA